MPAPSQHSLNRRLQRELTHLQWLQRQPSLAAQLRSCRRRILVLRTELAYRSCSTHQPKQPTAI